MSQPAEFFAKPNRPALPVEEELCELLRLTEVKAVEVVDAHEHCAGCQICWLATSLDCQTSLAADLLESELPLPALTELTEQTADVPLELAVV